MELFSSYFSSIFSEGEMRRNILALLHSLAFLFAIILTYALIFQLIMVGVEEQSHSWITGIYWALVTMTTLGVGDITFTSNIGRLFSVFVLALGVVLLLVVLPFTFIRLFYAPWLEAQVRLRAPRRLRPSVREHVIISRHDEIAAGLIERLRPEAIPYYVIEPDGTWEDGWIIPSLAVKGVAAVSKRRSRPQTRGGPTRGRIARLPVCSHPRPDRTRCFYGR